MADKLWKKAERQIAGFFGSERTPLSGSNSKHTMSDSLHPYLYIEAKYGKSLPKFFTDIWEEAEQNAKKENKTPLVALKYRGKKGFMVLCHSSDLERIANEKYLSR